MTRLRRTGLALGATLAALVAAEWVTSRWYPVGATTYRLDEELLHAPIPGARRIQHMPRRAGGASTLVVLNSSGYRGPALEEGSRGRIAVYGDSLVMAENVAFEESFPARLSVELGGRYELVSAGASGHGPDQVLLRIERELPRLQPDLILLLLCATNDYGDLLRNKLFSLEGEVLRRLHPKLDPSVSARFSEAMARSSRPALMRALASVSDRGRAAEQELQESSDPAPEFIPEYLEQAAWEYRNTVLEGDRTVYSLMQDVYDADVAIYPERPAARYKRELLSRLLTRLASSCRHSGVELACVIVPSAVDLDPDFRIRVSVERYPSYVPTTLTDTMLAATAQAGISARDLFGLFEANSPGELFVGWDDIHWNAAGIALAARDVAVWLGQEGLLPAD